MCFYTGYVKPSDKAVKALTAAEDIVCYKCLNVSDTGLISAMRGIPYEIGVTYRKNKMPASTRLRTFGSEGFHAYISHSKYFPESSIVVECIIPKGTRYYVNKSFGEYCSAAIKVVKVIRASKAEIRRWENEKEYLQRRILELREHVKRVEKRLKMHNKFAAMAGASK